MSAVMHPESALCLPGGGRRYSAGPRGAARQHEDSGSERQPEASELCQQPNPQEAETAGVQSLMFTFFSCI